MKKFIECYLPIKACNFRCKYCYVTQNRWWNSERPNLERCCKNIKEATNKERLGGECMFNICATGETLLFPEIVEIARGILENGHYIMIVTNGTLKNRFEEFCDFPIELRKHLFFKCSFHYLELKRLNKLNVFFENINMLKKSEISFTVELTPDDSYIPYIEEIKKVCMDNLGELCHVTVPRDERIKGYPLMTKLSREVFVKTWSSFNSALFDFKESIFEVKRKEYCYAGKWGIVLNLETGEYKQCYKGKKLGNLYEDMDKPLNLKAVGHNCAEGHCHNGHAFLGFGLIPDINTPDYADMRNRVLNDGTQWLSKETEAFMREKLKDSNKEDNIFEKMYSDLYSFHYKKFLKGMVKKDNEQ